MIDNLSLIAKIIIAIFAIGLLIYLSVCFAINVWCLIAAICTYRRYRESVIKNSRNYIVLSHDAIVTSVCVLDNFDIEVEDKIINLIQYCPNGKVIYVVPKTLFDYLRLCRTVTKSSDYLERNQSEESLQMLMSDIERVKKEHLKTSGELLGSVNFPKS